MKRFTSLLAAAAFAVATAACSQTDAGITTKIKTDMAQSDVVKANDINVTTQDNVVTLTGMVDTAAAKTEAVRIARNAEGVRDVVDELRVGEARATSGLREEAREEANELRDDAARGAEKTENAFEQAADATVDGAKKVGNATADGARKVGSTVRDAVTDDDRDSDNDGK